MASSSPAALTCICCLKRSAYQVCEILRAFIENGKTLLDGNNHFWSEYLLPDKFKSVREQYKCIASHYEHAKDLIKHFEETRLPFPLSAEVERAREKVAKYELILERMRSELNRQRALYERQEEMLKQNINQQLTLQKEGIEKKRKERHDQFAGIKEETQALKQQEDDIKKEMRSKKFFSKDFWKKRKELRKVNHEIKDKEKHIQRMTSAVFEHRASKEMISLTESLDSIQLRLDTHITMYVQKIRLHEMRLTEAKEKLAAIEEKEEKRRSRYFASVSEEIADELQAIYDAFLELDKRIIAFQEKKPSKSMKLKLDALSDSLKKSMGEFSTVLDDIWSPGNGIESMESDEATVSSDASGDLTKPAVYAIPDDSPKNDAVFFQSAGVQKGKGKEKEENIVQLRLSK